MSIIRVGLAETKHFAEGYDAIFGKKKAAKPAAKAKKAPSRSSSRKKSKKS